MLCPLYLGLEGNRSVTATTGIDFTPQASNRCSRLTEAPVTLGEPWKKERDLNEVVGPHRILLLRA